MYFNDIWSFYFHDPYNIDWSINSFKFICNISNIDDFIKLYITFREIIFKGMFFIMREHVQPIWEDENNINGGCFSLKIYKDNIKEKLFELSALLLGENLGKTDEISNNINGISISPKKNYYIIRIWIKNNTFAIKQNYNIEMAKYTTVLYKNHNL